MCIYIYIYTSGNYNNIYGLWNIRTGILDYLREGFPWPARPFKRTESNSFKHTVTTFKYTNWYFILPPGPRGLARPPHTYSKCRYRIFTYILIPKLKTSGDVLWIHLKSKKMKLKVLGGWITTISYFLLVPLPRLADCTTIHWLRMNPAWTTLWIHCF